MTGREEWNLRMPVFLLGKSRKNGRKNTILKTVYWYILWINYN